MEKDKGNRRCLLDLPLKNIDELVPFLMPMSLRRPGAGVKRCEVHADAHGRSSIQRHRSWRAPRRRSLRLHPQQRRALPMTFAGRMAKAPFLGLIALYRWTVSPLLGVNCRHLPSCSDYAREAIVLNGRWKGACVPR